MNILIVDDEELLRWSIGEHLSSEGYSTDEAEDGSIGLAKYSATHPDAVVLDLKMPNTDGMTVLKEIRKTDPHTPVIIMTAHGGIEDAVEAMKNGATHYLTKPFDLRELSVQLEAAFENVLLKEQVRMLSGKSISGYETVIHASSSMKKVVVDLQGIEEVDGATVLITGESGTGKDVIARAIHANGQRKEKPFLAVDCTSLPETLIESELFGHEKGAFTDAKALKRGLFEVAGEGIIFLDELGELELPLQAKLLRALENRTFRRVGGTKDIQFKAQVIAATNRDLKKRIAQNQFREDLYYRLNVVSIELPPLREREHDASLIADHILMLFKRKYNRSEVIFSNELYQFFNVYRWPGNIRELRNVVERLVVLHGKNERLELTHLPVGLVDSITEHVQNDEKSPFEAMHVQSPHKVTDDASQLLVDDILHRLLSSDKSLEDIERELLAAALNMHDGNQSKAAKQLKLTRYAFRYRAEKHGLI